MKLATGAHRAHEILVFAGASRSPSRRRGGVVTKSTDIATRAIRPHTAHGTRSNDANAEVSAANGDSRAGCKVDPVVAGARGMMRWVNM